MLETVGRAVTRAQCRAQLRHCHTSGDLSSRWLSRTLDVSRATAQDMMALPTFGLLWQACERSSPWLAHVPLSPSLLNNEIQVATEWLRSHAMRTSSLLRIEHTPHAMEVPA
jgi:hypothetical protein